MEKIINVGIIGQGRSGRDIHAFALELPRLKNLATRNTREKPFGIILTLVRLTS